MLGKESAGAVTPAPEPRLVSRTICASLVAQVSPRVKDFRPPPFPDQLSPALVSS